MADFCNQCADYMFGPGYRDYENIGNWEGSQPLKEGESYLVICEGCGFVRIDAKGNCLGDAECLEKHEKV